MTDAYIINSCGEPLMYMHNLGLLFLVKKFQVIQSRVHTRESLSKNGSIAISCANFSHQPVSRNLGVPDVITSGTEFLGRSDSAMGKSALKVVHERAYCLYISCKRSSTGGTIHWRRAALSAYGGASEKRRVLGCTNRHPFPHSRSADFLSNIADRKVKMRLKRTDGGCMMTQAPLFSNSGPPSTEPGLGSPSSHARNDLHFAKGLWSGEECFLPLPPPKTESLRKASQEPWRGPGGGLLRLADEGGRGKETVKRVRVLRTLVMTGHRWDAPRAAHAVGICYIPR